MKDKIRIQTIIVALSMLSTVSAGLADTLLIDEDFTSSTIAGSSRIYLSHAGDGSGDDWIKGSKVTSDWAISDGVMGSPASTIDNAVSEGVIGQLYTVGSTDTSLTKITISFDYTVGVGSTLRFFANGLTTNGAPGVYEALYNTGVAHVNPQDSVDTDFADISLLTGEDPKNQTGSVTFDGGAAGASGTYSITVDLTSLSWSADEAPGVSGSLENITDLEHIAFMFGNDVTVTDGSGAVSVDNFKVTGISDSVRNTFMVLGNPYVEFPEEAKLSIMGSIEQAVEDADIDFVIIVGELTINAETEQFEAIKYLMENAPVPVYVTGGNHDLAYDNGDWQTGIPDDYAYFTEMLGVETEYSFSKGRSYFIMQTHDDDVGYDYTNSELAELEGDTSYDFVYQITESPLLKGIDLTVKPLIGITGGNKSGNLCQLVGGRHPRFIPIEHKYTEDEVDYMIVNENDGYIILDSYLDRTWAQSWKVTVDRAAGTSSVESYTYPSVPEPDAEVNGVPESWLASYGLELTEAETLADTDDDGLTNLEEYLTGKDPLINDSSPEIRVTEYYLTDEDFSGATATVQLDQKLNGDYFILVRGSRAGDDISFPDNNYARITGVPAGLGEMAGSGGWYNLVLTRVAATTDWEGVVTVVECNNPLSAAGFDLVDIMSTSLTGTSGTDTSNDWHDLDQVVLFGGYRGGGASFVGEVDDRNQGSSIYTRIYPTGTNTLNWSRDAAGETLVDAEMTTFVVEWGSEWKVQHVNVTGSNGGNGADVTGEYTTVEIENVSRDNSWVWATGTRLDAGIGDCSESCLVTLGDGVHQNATESTVAVGSEYTDAYDFDVYVLTHPSIAIDHRFVEDANHAVSDIAVSVDEAIDGTRFGWSYNGLNGTGNWHPCGVFWARYTSDSEITLSRGFSAQNFPAWVQGIDLSGLND